MPCPCSESDGGPAFGHVPSQLGFEHTDGSVLEAPIRDTPEVDGRKLIERDVARRRPEVGAQAEHEPGADRHIAQGMRAPGSGTYCRCRYPHRKNVASRTDSTPRDARAERVVPAVVFHDGAAGPTHGWRSRAGSEEAPVALDVEPAVEVDVDPANARRLDRHAQPARHLLERENAVEVVPDLCAAPGTGLRVEVQVRWRPCR